MVVPNATQMIGSGHIELPCDIVQVKSWWRVVWDRLLTLCVAEQTSILIKHCKIVEVHIVGMVKVHGDGSDVFTVAVVAQENILEDCRALDCCVGGADPEPIPTSILDSKVSEVDHWDWR